jgi:hypothetical protein
LGRTAFVGTAFASTIDAGIDGASTAGARMKLKLELFTTVP